MSDGAPESSGPPALGRAPARREAVVQGPTYRFTVLTSRLVRMEHSESGVFVDAPSQLAVDRQFDVPAFEVTESEASLEIRTEHLRLSYDKKAFTPSGLTVTMLGRVQSSHRSTWHYGNLDPGLPGRPGNLGGTARTLDDVDGRTDLGTGLLSGNGHATVDDSGSLLLTDDGWLVPRPDGAGQDVYFFGYGRDYPAALRDYFRLAGPTPLLPRFTLGNWWSRYHPYSDAEYLALMDRFAAEGIPFSVAVLDVDWHVVDVDPRYGTGWTGYTWNRDLFADPAAFLDELHDRGLRVTLNVHPADGVRGYEDAYADVARDLGIDPDSHQTIPFDITSRAFAESYLARLHHPHEELGVDFWWLDWQSGSYSRIPGLDPLWLLNHLHFRDSARGGRRPLTFSRYAGHGSHRYPVGFSGDTVVSWDSLRFQPEFTATAANVGYFWWSHDVGGHLGGTKDDELATRWVQLGALSPINRLHSTASTFNAKEPWRYSDRAAAVMSRFLRLRHRLVPYLYTVNWLAHTDGAPPVRPMYHDHPHAPEAYEVPNQFLLGPSLLVAPITEPAERRSHQARVDAWLPPGTWYDLLSSRRYDGGSTGRRLALHRSLEAVPVLARAGSILPLAADPMADVAANPAALVLRVHAGADGELTLLEDDGAGEVTAENRHETPVRWQESGVRAELTIALPRGSGVLTRRTLTVELVGIAAARVRVGTGEDLAELAAPAVTPSPSVLTIELGEVDLAGGYAVRLSDVRPAEPEIRSEIFRLLDEAEIDYRDKEMAHRASQELDDSALAGSLYALDLPDALYGALLEVLTAARP
ncbi:glycoside hydrolase family 31 protein [Georgenia subflava]|uniref:Glycoside hydrolase n=1 Tax=Georgenia subflava TaxID=1622177 RepID=A0A6N7EP10_9MICO|nr:glycoside hydrolase family 31 protein [Georgenia subflava]MPV38853.1 glycoside hydrolase [Georgenia subflava]